MTDRDLLEEAASALYGRHWHSALARHLGVTMRTVQRWDRGDRSVPRSALVSLRKALEEHSGELKRIAKKLP